MFIVENTEFLIYKGFMIIGSISFESNRTNQDFVPILQTPQENWNAFDYDSEREEIYYVNKVSGAEVCFCIQVLRSEL